MLEGNDATSGIQGRRLEGNSDLVMRSLTSAIYYIVAKVGHHFLRDIDILPLQGLAWQTDVVSITISYYEKYILLEQIKNNYEVYFSSWKPI